MTDETDNEFVQEGATVRSSRPPADAGSASTVPDFELARQHVLQEIVGFADTLQREGVAVPTTGSLEAARALAVVGLSDRDAVAAAVRATLCSESADLEAFEEHFPTFWHHLTTGLDGISTGQDSSASPEQTGVEPTTPPSTPERDDPSRLSDGDPPPFDPDANEEGDEPGSFLVQTGRHHSTDARASDAGSEQARRYSATGRSERVAAPVVDLSDAERAAVDRFVGALATAAGRRTRPYASSGTVDARRALRASLETGGTPIDLPYRTPQPTELRCCLLVDVSGSVLDTIDRASMLAILERIVRSARQCRLFLFDSGLVEVTSQFEHSRGDPASALGAAEVQWGGGTQIGTALETVRTRYPHAVDRNTVVVVISDGLDVGEQATLETGITWLARRSSHLLWLNPLAVSPAYEPLSRGMATCLPYVDGLFGFATATDLLAIAEQIERRGLEGPIGYEYHTHHTQHTQHTQHTHDSPTRP